MAGRSLNSAFIHSLNLSNTGGKRTFFSQAHGLRLTIHDTALEAVKKAEADSNHTAREEAKLRRYADERDRYLRLTVDTKPNACLGDIKSFYEKVKDDMGLELRRWDGYAYSTQRGKRIVLELIFETPDDRDNMNTAIGARFGCQVTIVNSAFEKAIKTRGASEMEGNDEDEVPRRASFARDDASHASARSGAQSLSSRYKH